MHTRQKPARRIDLLVILLIIYASTALPLAFHVALSPAVHTILLIVCTTAAIAMIINMIYGIVANRHN